MSSPSNARPTSANRSGPRVALWVVIVLTLALLVWMTVFTAQRNPYLSDVGRNKISRSDFIEQCKTKFDEFAATVGKSQNAVFDTEYDPRSLVSGAVSNPQAPGWLLSSQVSVSRAGLGSQSVPFACQSDASGAVTLVQGAQGGPGQPQQP
ncbi:hypothetical protein [Deinococcus altitudinis]|uniref:hypothetical protein n=1 Tax=Deinococcus altitudinis TaxID=468914 RepID=UPI0038921A53